MISTILLDNNSPCLLNGVLTGVPAGMEPREDTDGVESIQGLRVQSVSRDFTPVKSTDVVRVVFAAISPAKTFNVAARPALPSGVCGLPCEVVGKSSGGMHGLWQRHCAPST